MEPDGVAPGATFRSVLNEVASLSGRVDTKAEARQFIVPDDMVFALRLDCLYKPFGQFGHAPVLRSPGFEYAPRKHAEGNQGVFSDRDCGVPILKSNKF